MVIKYPCGICEKAVAKNHKAVVCDLCDKWVHCRCSNVSLSEYNDMIDDANNDESTNKKWICIKCINSNISFSSIDDKHLYTTMNGINSDNDLANISFSLSPSDKKITESISKIILETSDPTSQNSNFCKYYETKDFINSNFQKTTNFSTLHLNIASLQFHHEELKILLEMLDFEFDCIMISETKIQKDTPPIKNIDIAGYHIFHTPTEANKGGTLIYISNKLVSKPRKDLEFYQAKDVESTFAEIIVPNGKNIIVGCVYKHHTIEINDFEKLFLPKLRKINKEKKPVVVAGDFNIDLLKLNSHSQTNKYFDEITNLNFMPLITLPTRITSKSKTLIDNILFNQFVPDIKSGNLDVSISDHTPQFSIIPIHINKVKNNKRDIYARNYNHSNLSAIKNIFDHIQWGLNDSHSSVNTDMSNFIEKSTAAINTLFPLKKLSNKQKKQRSKPWISNEIIREIKIRDTIYSKHRKTSSALLKEKLEMDLRIQKGKVKSMLQRSKSLYFSKYFSENSSNMKKLWDGVNQIISSSKSKSPNTIKSLEINDLNNIKTTITNTKDICNTANQYFTNIANDILKQCKYKGNKSFKYYLKNPNLNKFIANPTTSAEVESIIKDFDTSKAVGPNSIPPKILKIIAPFISEPLTIIINKSLLTGTYPEPLKTSKINPLHKKDSRLTISNYRPISLLSNLNKIFEKLMFKQLYSFLEVNKSIYELQFGFRENHSTNHAIISIMQKIQEAIKNDNFAIGIFIDLQKAFDTVNHSILLEKLNHYGVSDVSNSWFKTYLTQRKQYVCIGGEVSDLTTTEHGVPQGSVLGPLLFLIYINDLHQCIKNSNTFHFADDTNLLYIPPKKMRNRNIIRKLNTDLKSLNYWLMANKISLNSSKTELIIFRDKNKIVPPLNIKLNGIKLIPKSEIKYLGLTMDEHLTFKTHINITNAKLKRANNLLALSRHYLPRTFLKQVYYAQFHSHLVYGCQVWGYESSNIRQTLSLQKKAVKLMMFADNNSPTDPIFNELGILKLDELIKTNNIIFTHKTLNNNSPSHFQNYYELYTPTHGYPTSNNPTSTYSIPPGSIKLLEAEAGTFKCKCAQDWNFILKKLSNASSQANWLLDLSVSRLKSLTKSFFLNTYIGN